MVSVKGPRSALTDFIEEHGIKIDKYNNKPVDNKKEVIVRKKRTVKKIYKKSRPFELSSTNNQTKSLQDVLISKILLNFSKFELDDNHLEMISSYLSTQRNNTKEFYCKLEEKCKDRLVVYDCSMLKEDDFVSTNDGITALELHQCGQLTNYKLLAILNFYKNLNTLRITGAYLITEVCLPTKLKIIDFSNCNRLSNSIITEINKKYKKLDELRLSYCYKITDDFKLKTNVKRLFLDETRISEKFFNEKCLTALSLKNCQLIDNLHKKYTNLEYLDLENITTVDNLNIGNKLKHLNITRCYNLKDWILKNKSKLCNLEYLNVSYLDFEDFDFLFDFTILKKLDLSWCKNVTDDLIIRLIERTNLENISVFGCFNLTTKSAKVSYENKDRILIIGNHSETKYQLQTL